MVENREMREGCDIRLRSLEVQFEDVKDIKEIVLTLKIFVENLISDGRKRETKDDKLTTAIDSINKNLTHLNGETSEIKRRVGDVEQRQNIQYEDNSININKLLKNSIIGFLMLVLSSLGTLALSGFFK